MRTYGLLAKKPLPVWDIPASRKAAGDNRTLAVGIRSPLYILNIVLGMFPRDAGVGGGCGGLAVGGRPSSGLKTVYINSPRENESAAEGCNLRIED